MAIVYAIANGDWSNSAIWSSGTIPTANDDVYANNRTVTVDINATAKSIQALALTTPAITAGGKFQILSGSIAFNFGTLTPRAASNAYETLMVEHSSGTVTLNGIIVTSGTSGSGCYGIWIKSSSNVVYNGDVTGLQIQGGFGIYKTGSGLLTLNGNVYGGTSAAYQTWGVNASNGNTIINGNVYAGTLGGTSWVPWGLRVGAGATATVNGDVYNSANGGYASGIGLEGGACTVNGQLYMVASTSAPVVLCYAASSTLTVNVSGDGNASFTNANTSNGYIAISANNCIVTYNGNIAAGTSSQFINMNASSCVVTINGVCSSGSSTTAPGGSIVYITGSLNTINFEKDVTVGSASAVVIFNSGINNIVYFKKKIIGNNFGFNQGTRQAYAATYTSTNNKVYVSQIECGPYGAYPLCGFYYIIDAADNYVTVARDGSTAKTLADDRLSAGFLPAASNVRSGTIYGLNGQMLGTCAVPASGSVAFGVPVDSTTGTAILDGGTAPTAEQIADAIRVELSPELERIANCATVQSTGDQIAAAF